MYALDRRRFLQLSALAVSPLAAALRRKVKITDVKCMIVRGTWDWNLVKIETDAGLYGIGEAYWGPGVKDVIVITTQDAVLVIGRDQGDRVKQLVEHLRNSKRREATEHKRMYRPWGYYQSIDQGARYQVKRIVVTPGQRLSLQKHYHRAEHWIVVKGTAEVTRGEEIKIVHENESIYLPIGVIHRLANPGKINLELIEVQTGSYTGEDDIVRIEDIYDRAGK